MAKLMTIGLVAIFLALGIGAHVVASQIASAMDNSANQIAGARVN
jgi:hypothetical protein